MNCIFVAKKTSVVAWLVLLVAEQIWQTILIGIRDSVMFKMNRAEYKYRQIRVAKGVSPMRQILNLCILSQDEKQLEISISRIEESGHV